MNKWNTDTKRAKDRGEKKTLNQVYHDKTSQQIPAQVSPHSLRSYYFFIYLQLSAGAQADKQLQLFCERPVPLPEPHLMIMKCMINYIAKHCLEAYSVHAHTQIQSWQQKLPSCLTLNFHTDKYAHSAFQKASPLLWWKYHFPLFPTELCQQHLSVGNILFIYFFFCVPFNQKTKNGR